MPKGFRSTIHEAPINGSYVRPEQFWEQIEVSNLLPEAKLVVAVLKDCAVSLRRTRRCHGKLQFAEQEDDMDWLESDADHPFSFVWCCQALKLDESAVRESLKQELTKHDVLG